MTKKLMTLLLALLTMTACHDSKDEPSPNPAIQSIVLLCTDNIIYNLEGDTVFQTDADSHIQSLDSEGSDWYALISKVGGIYDIIRNGKSVFTTSQEIKAMGMIVCSILCNAARIKMRPISGASGKTANPCISSNTTSGIHIMTLR